MIRPKDKTVKYTNVSTTAQQRRLLEFLSSEEGLTKGINRYEAEAKLNICSLAPRKLELKELGYEFITVREMTQDSYGQPHCGIARYYLKLNKKVNK